MRSSKDAENFPYKLSTMCYIEVDPHGTVSQVPHKNKSDWQGVHDAYQRVQSGSATLYAVWPGNWRSDLFLIDDLDAFAKAFGLD